MRNKLNEKLYVDELINGRVHRNKMMGELKLVAKYYNNDKVDKAVEKIEGAEGKNQEKVKIIYPKVIKFAQTYYSDLYVPDIHDVKIMKVVKYYGLQKLYIAPKVSLTKTELDIINSLKEKRKENLQQRKLAFMLLLLSKIKGRGYNGKYYILENEWAFWKFAGLDDLTQSKRYNLLNQLQDNGLIKQMRLHDKKSTLSIEILFVDSGQGNVELVVDDYANPKNIYLKYLGKTFITCEKCGVETLKNSNNQRYCKHCSVEAKKENVRECVRKLRNKKCNKVESDKIAI